MRRAPRTRTRAGVRAAAQPGSVPATGMRLEIDGLSLRAPEGFVPRGPGGRQHPGRGRPGRVGVDRYQVGIGFWFAPEVPTAERQATMAAVLSIAELD